MKKATSENGTCLQGYVHATLADLKKAFGEPHFYEGDKTTVEWAFETPDKTVFTIYDYKTYGTPINTYAWHIGGHDNKVLHWVQALLPNNLVKGYRE